MINILAINITKQVEEPYKVQEILTMYGNIIRTRVGLSSFEDDNSGLRGIIILEILCAKDDEQFLELQKQLKSINGIKIGTIDFE
ncbi:MAG: hypothetical protein ACOXZK_03520 [Bacteroidales bacterium]|jgi:hypothetical protein|nr:hypothetical protein [Bacteroidales bacterium]